MRNQILTLLFLLSSSVLLKALDASVSFCTFKGEASNYIELYLHFVGETIKHKELSAGQLQANVEVLILFKQEEKIIQVDKFNLQSPITDKRKDFIDLKRYGLKNGAYQLVIDVVDLENPENKRQFSQAIEIGFHESELEQSDIQLLASVKQANGTENNMVKNGVEMEPLPYAWYSARMDNLIFYNEIYNSDQSIAAPFFISYSIIDASDQGSQKTISQKRKRLEPASVLPVLENLSIRDLPSGNYLFNVEVFNRDKELLSQKAIFFQRSNPTADPQIDSTSVENAFVNRLSANDLEYAVRAISLHVPQDAEMLNSIIRDKKVEAQKIYLLSFWNKQNAANPEISYNKYMEVARAVDNMFESGFGHGFETDRGLIYMKYGRPSDITRVEDEVDAPPYEVWSYNEFPKTNQHNVRFLFYNPSLSPGNFQLLHSTARGELNNPNWQLDLYSETPGSLNGNHIEGGTVNDGFGRRAVEYFNDF